MKRLLFTFVLFGTCSIKLFAQSSNFGSETGCVSVTTTTTSPTLLFSSSNSSKRTTVVNPSSYPLYVADSNRTISTTTDFYVPANSSWSPDGPFHQYLGSIYGVIGGGATASQTICKQRSY